MITTVRYVATQKGGPFQLLAVPRPTPGPGEVAIRLKAVALNPWDCRQVYDGALVESWPVAIGADGAGIVEVVGENVTTLEVGDEVFSLFGHGEAAAAFQEVAIVPEYHVGRKPSQLGYNEASTLPLTFMTASAAIYVGLDILLPFLPGGMPARSQIRSVLVAGGSSNVGAAAVQILRLVLPTALILTTSSVAHHAHLHSLGATTTFDRYSPDLVADIRSATPNGQGVDAIIDAVGAIAARSSLIEVLDATGPKKVAEVFAGKTAECPPGVDKHLIFGRSMLEAPGGKNIFTALARLLSAGKYRTPTAVREVGNGFETIAAGLEELENKVSGMKLVVSIS